MKRKHYLLSVEIGGVENYAVRNLACIVGYKLSTDPAKAETFGENIKKRWLAQYPSGRAEAVGDEQRPDLEEIRQIKRELQGPLREKPRKFGPRMPPKLGPVRPRAVKFGPRKPMASSVPAEEMATYVGDPKPGEEMVTYGRGVSNTSWPMSAARNFRKLAREYWDGLSRSKKEDLVELLNFAPDFQEDRSTIQSGSPIDSAVRRTDTVAEEVANIIRSSPEFLERHAERIERNRKLDAALKYDRNLRLSGIPVPIRFREDLPVNNPPVTMTKADGTQAVVSMSSFTVDGKSYDQSSDNQERNLGRALGFESESDMFAVNDAAYKAHLRSLPIFPLGSLGWRNAQHKRDQVTLARERLASTKPEYSAPAKLGPVRPRAVKFGPRKPHLAYKMTEAGPGGTEIVTRSLGWTSEDEARSVKQDEKAAAFRARQGLPPMARKPEYVAPAGENEAPRDYAKEAEDFWNKLPTSKKSELARIARGLNTLSPVLKAEILKNQRSPRPDENWNESHLARILWLAKDFAKFEEKGEREFQWLKKYEAEKRAKLGLPPSPPAMPSSGVGPANDNPRLPPIGGFKTYEEAKKFAVAQVRELRIAHGIEKPTAHQGYSVKMLPQPRKDRFGYDSRLEAFEPEDYPPMVAPRFSEPVTKFEASESPFALSIFDHTPAGFDPITPQHLPSNLNRDQLREWFVKNTSRLPIIPADVKDGVAWARARAVEAADEAFRITMQTGGKRLWAYFRPADRKDAPLSLRPAGRKDAPLTTEKFGANLRFAPVGTIVRRQLPEEVSKRIYRKMGAEKFDWKEILPGPQGWRPTNTSMRGEIFTNILANYNQAPDQFSIVFPSEPKAEIYALEAAEPLKPESASELTFTGMPAVAFEDQTESESLNHAKDFLSILKAQRFIGGSAWHKSGVGSRVYLRGDSYLSFSRGGDISNTHRGFATYLPSSFLLWQREAIQNAIKIYNKGRLVKPEAEQLSTTASHVREFSRLRGDYTRADKAYQDARSELERAYGTVWKAPSGKQKKLEPLSRRQSKASDKFYDLLGKISPRQWEEGVPTTWVLNKLSYEDAVRPADEPLQDFIPTAYGAEIAQRARDAAKEESREKEKMARLGVRVQSADSMEKAVEVKDPGFSGILSKLSDRDFWVQYLDLSRNLPAFQPDAFAAELAKRVKKFNTLKGRSLRMAALNMPEAFIKYADGVKAGPYLVNLPGNTILQINGPPTKGFKNPSNSLYILTDNGTWGELKMTGWNYETVYAGANPSDVAQKLAGAKPSEILTFRPGSKEHARFMDEASSVTDVTPAVITLLREYMTGNRKKDAPGGIIRKYGPIDFHLLTRALASKLIERADMNDKEAIKLTDKGRALL
jgi:hypothetical protein